MPVEAGSLVMDRLRRQTRDYPKRIEGTPCHKAILEGRASREIYTDLIRKMWAFHLGFELAVRDRREWEEFGFPFESRSKLGALARDLEALGVNPDPTRRLELPLAEASFPFVCGYLYVIESSTLAGQNLFRIVKAKLGINPQQGGSYYTSYGDRAGLVWRECQDFFERVGQSRGGAVSDMASGAEDGFQKLLAWLKEPGA
jgi:heme oxygenase